MVTPASVRYLRNTPADVRFIWGDPKRVDDGYNGTYALGRAVVVAWKH